MGKVEGLMKAKFNVHHLTEVCEALLDGEPVFIIRAQDEAAPVAIDAYITASRNVGGTNTSRSNAQLQRVMDWRREHKDRIKVPD